MRPLEILIPLILALYLCWPLFSRRRPPALGILPTFALIVMLTHNRVEGMRWQMYPLYAFAVLIFLTSLPAFLRAHGEGEVLLRPTGRRLWKLLASLSLLAVSTIPPALLPVSVLSTPRGPYAVGTVTRLLVDESRREIYSDTDEPRKLMMQIWYPAQPPAPEAQPAAWLPDAKRIAPSLAELIGLPHFVLGHLALIKTSAYEEILPAREGGPYPTLVFIHAWNGFRQQSASLMQELASHGYMVVALDLPYGACAVTFPDGSLVTQDFGPSPPGQEMSQREYESLAVSVRNVTSQWSSDIGYTLDILAEMNAQPGELLTGLFDLDRIGIFGHSTGGGAVIRFCGADDRCKAGLTYDAFMLAVDADTLETGTRQPFLYLFSELWTFEHNNKLFEAYYAHVPQSTHVLIVSGASHYDFTDLPALSPLSPYLGFKGPIQTGRMRQILANYSLAFFDLTLKGKPAPLLEGPSPDYPEVRFDG